MRNVLLVLRSLPALVRNWSALALDAFGARRLARRVVADDDVLDDPSGGPLR